MFRGVPGVFRILQTPIKFCSKATQRAKPRSKSINFNVYANSNVLILHVLKTLVFVNNLKEAYSTN